MSIIKNDVSIDKNIQSNLTRVKDLSVPRQISQNTFAEFNDEFVLSKKKRGLIAKFYAAMTNIIPFGLSDKKVKRTFIDYDNGLIEDKKQVSELISKREGSVIFGTEMLIDTVSTISAMLVGLNGKKITTIVNNFTPKLSGKAKILTAGASILAGVGSKLVLKGIDSIGKSKEARAENKKSKKSPTILIDSIGGYLSSISPLFLPVTFLTNLVMQYSKAKNVINDDINKNTFLTSLKDNADIIALSALSLGYIGAKGHINFSKLSKSIDNIKINRAHTNSYIPPKDQLTEFQQLARDIGYDLTILVKNGKVNLENISKLDEDFLSILMNPKLNGQIEQKIKLLEQENIFLPKYLQTVIDISDSMQSQISSNIDDLVKTKNSKTIDWDIDKYAIRRSFEKMDEKGWDINGLKDLQGIVQHIKSNCPMSREINDAQAMLDKAFLKGNYKIDKVLGVGSIAESYLAKNAEGDEVVIKIVKEHFLKGNKIANDKKKILDKIEMRAQDDWSLYTSKQTIKTRERKQYDIEQVDNMYKVWGSELNLSKEAESALEISSQASKFRAVDVIESSDNIFIMQKAPGVQMDSSRFVQEWKKANLNEEDFTNFVENYVKVYCEQLFSLPKTGKKVVQSDPHGGNILVDVTKIRDLLSGTKPITIIDYGNTTKTERKVAIKNLFNHIDYLVGNTDGIATAMLEGVKCSPKEKSRIIKRLSKALKEEIYNVDTKIEIDNPVKIFSTVNSFCLNFLQKNNIIPNASHINQMKAEETYIISNLGCLRNVAESCGYDINKAIDKNKIIKILINEMSNAVKEAAKNEPKTTATEIVKRYNFFMNSSEEALTSLAVNFGL